MTPEKIDAAGDTADIRYRQTRERYDDLSEAVALHINAARAALMNTKRTYAKRMLDMSAALDAVEDSTRILIEEMDDAVREFNDDFGGVYE